MKEVKPAKVTIPRYRTPDDRMRVRVLMARKVLMEMIVVARDQAGPQRWISVGGLELEDFLYDLDTGYGKRWLKEWQQHSPQAGRPAASPRERMAQWYICLAVVALERVFSLGPGEARKEVAKKAARVFERPPTAKTIEHWQDNRPILSPDVELWLNNTITASRVGEPDGRDRLLDNFIALAHAVMTPGAVMVDDE